MVANFTFFYAQPRICPRESNARNYMGFWGTNWSPNLGETTRPSDNQQKRMTGWIVNFAVPTDHGLKLKENEKKDNYLDLTRELEKNCVQYSHQGTCTETGRLGKKRTSEEHPNYSFINIGQNTEKSAGDLRRVALTQTPVLVWKNLKRVI